MRYDLKNPFHQEQARHRLASLLKKGAVVEITEKRPRSLSQNAYLHVILRWYALFRGETEEYVKTIYFKGVNKHIFQRAKFDKTLGREVEYLRLTEELTTEEMSEAITRFRDWAAMQDEPLYIPAPEEREYLFQLETEVERNSRYL